MRKSLRDYLNRKGLGEKRVINSEKKGSLLEWIIKRLFQSLDIYASNTYELKGNQIDVFANYDGKKIIVECKQYEKGSLTVKNLIHEWNSKKEEIGCDKCLLVLWGFPEVKQEDTKRARKLNISVWNDPKITHFFNLLLKDKEEARKKIIMDLDIDSEEVRELKRRTKNRLQEKYSTIDQQSIEELKEEVFNCYLDGHLFNVFKFRILQDILRGQGFCITAESSYVHWGHCKIRNQSDFDIEKIKKSGPKKTHNVVGRDGRTFISIEEFLNQDSIEI